LALKYVYINIYKYKVFLF